MALNRNLKRDVNRLVDTGGLSSTGLPGRPSNTDITEQTGTGVAEVTNTRTVSTATKIEVLTVYSSIIVTEDGAFEKPLGWPNSGVYNVNIIPGNLPNPVPPSLSVTGVTATLDTSIAYYEQRRVHQVIFSIDGSLEIQKLLVILEMPYLKAASGTPDSPSAYGFYSGVTPYSPWHPLLKMVTFNSGDQALDTLVKAQADILLSYGVAYE